MTDFNQNVDQARDMLNLEQKDMQKLPQMLNVLTILTYIGSAIAAISAVYSYFTINASYKLIENMNSTTESLGSSESKALQGIINQSAEIVRKQYENRLLILVITLAGAALCFYGAMQMRNLKKQGYMMYVIGELLPVLAVAIFVGFGSLFGGMAVLLSLLVPVLFIVLYTTQRKVLVN
jgi:hypothetical protein